MQFGVCLPSSEALAAKAGGWDFVEGNVRQTLRGLESEWDVPAPPALVMPTANSFVPASLPITGPKADRAALSAYVERVMTRAHAMRIDTLVFGSGAARNVPDGFDRLAAEGQISDFLALAGDHAASNGVTLVIEPLNRGESNILNTVAEAMKYVTRLGHPAVRCLVDSYHFWLEDEPLKNLEAAMPSIAHVHVADRDGRVAPGESRSSDYDAFFKILKVGGYDGRVAVECREFDLRTNGPRSLKFLQDAWARA